MDTASLPGVSRVVRLGKDDEVAVEVTEPDLRDDQLPSATTSASGLPGMEVEQRAQQPRALRRGRPRAGHAAPGPAGASIVTSQVDERWRGATCFGRLRPRPARRAPLAGV